MSHVTEIANNRNGHLTAVRIVFFFQHGRNATLKRDKCPGLVKGIKPPLAYTERNVRLISVYSTSAFSLYSVIDQFILLHPM